MAPWEYAIFTLVAHLVMIMPYCLVALLRSLPSEESKRKETDKIEYWHEVTQVFLTAFDIQYHGLCPSLASANNAECEFKGIKSPSWHGLVLLYARRSILIIDEGITLGSRAHSEMVNDPKWKREFLKIHLRLEKPNVPIRKAMKDLKGVQRKLLTIPEKELRPLNKKMMQFWSSLAVLNKNGLLLVDGDFKTLAMRLQQELPRAWAFKYGLGNSDFFRINATDALRVESCFVPRRAVGPRNEYFQKMKDEDGLGSGTIASTWNRMPIEKRREIAPKAPGNVSRDQVKKALQRDSKKKS